MRSVSGPDARPERADDARRRRPRRHEGQAGAVPGLRLRAHAPARTLQQAAVRRSSLHAGQTDRRRPRVRARRKASSKKARVPTRSNNFQARYAIRHAWTGPIRCEHPNRNLWGGPTADVAADPSFKPAGTMAATDLAFAPRNAVQLTQVVNRDVPEIDLKASASVSTTPADPAHGRAVPAKETTKKTGCGCASTDRNDLAGGALLVGVISIVRRRRRKTPRRT